MKSIVIPANDPDFVGRSVVERVKLLACRLLRERRFVGRFELEPQTWSYCEYELLHSHQPTFKFAGSIGGAADDAWHIELIVAGALVRIYVDPDLGELAVRAAVTE